MVIVKAMNIPRGLLLVCSQLVASIFASYIVSVLFPTEFNGSYLMPDYRKVLGFADISSTNHTLRRHFDRTRPLY